MALEAEEMELPMNARLIRRVKKTKRQKELGPAERRKNLGLERRKFLNYPVILCSHLPDFILQIPQTVFKICSVSRQSKIW